MRILHLVYDHPGNPWVGGGGAVRVYELSKRLAARGHEITVVSGRYPGAEDYSEGSLHYRFVGSRLTHLISTLTYTAAAASYTRAHGEGFDVVIEDFSPWNPVFSRYLTSRPTVIHLNHIEGLNILGRWPVVGLPSYMIEKFYPGRFRHITALSEGTRKKIGLGRTLVIPAGISQNIIREPAGDGDGTVVYVGRLHIRNKGLDTLIGAVRLLEGVELNIVGRGRDEGRLKSMSRGLNVKFAGFLPEDDKLDAIGRASLFVLPSRFEGWGIAVLEAAACSRPVVVSDIEELSFAVREGFGLSFRKGDKKALASRIRQLLENRDLRRQMGAKARQYVMGHTWEKIAVGYEKYLDGLVHGARRKHNF